MKKKFCNIPSPLRKQIITQLGLGLFCLVIFVILISCTLDIFLSFPCLILALFLLGKGVKLFYNCKTNRYVAVTGNCIDFERAIFGKRLKAIYVSTEQYMIKLPIRKKLKQLSVGDIITIYLSEKMPVYQRDNVFLISSYYALEIKKEK